MKRFALYYAPPDGPFASRAAAWLGYDATKTQAPARPETGFDGAALTTDPRRYGFHATLKAPFRLAPGVTPRDLCCATAALAAELAPFDLPGLSLSQIGGFLALVPMSPSAALQQLAARLVTALDPLRAALTPAEIARRRPERLSARQRQLLDLYGYPWVLEEFRFHMTLSNGDLTPAQVENVRAFLTGYLCPVVPRPLPVQQICLFGEPPQGPFRLLQRFALTGTA